jgi:hypothetical protein
MKRKRVVIYVNGILTIPGNGRNWTGRAVTYTHLHADDLYAEKLEYFVGVLGRSLGQAGRAAKLATMLRYYEGWEITLVGHSNGCDVILDALRSMGWPEIHALHLISGACDPDFDKNGLNASGRRIGRICVYIAGADWALSLASTWAGKLLGYGDLGRRGPVNARRLVEVVREPFGHSDWFADERLDETMAFVLAR